MLKTRISIADIDTLQPKVDCRYATRAITQVFR